ncbi:MAG: MFS transporter [Actinomycetota bacterium]|nr:MFS transporter [Actinomycetota bacterium]
MTSTTVPIDLKSKAGRFTLIATILASAIVFLDSTVVTVAIPSIQRDFSAAFSSMQWVGDAYFVTLTAFLLIGGSYGDLFGRKRAFVIGLVSFTLGSILCGSAPSIGFLIAARAIQGLGGALLIPSSLAIITATFGEEQRGRAIGIWAATSGLGAAVGPLVGGALIDAFSWRWIFYINIPLAIVTLLFARAQMPETRDESAVQHLSTASGAAAAVALGGGAYCLIQGPVDGFTNPRVLIASVVAVISAFAYWYVERRAKQPMIPHGVFRNIRFTSVQVATLTIYFALNGVFVFIILGAQQIHHLSSLKAGASLIPITSLLLLLSPTVGKVAGKIGPKIPIAAGALLCAIGVAIAAFWGPHESYFTLLLPALVVFGVGLSFIVAPITGAAVASLGQRHAGVASAVNNAVSRLAGLLAFAILPGISLVAFTPALHQQISTIDISSKQKASLLVNVDKQGGLEAPKGLSSDSAKQVTDAISEAFYRGYRLTLFCVAGVMLIGGIIALLFVGKPDESLMQNQTPPL